MGKFTKDSLTTLGGNLVFEYGESDHEYQKVDIESKYFNPWKKGIWHHLHKHYKQVSSPRIVKRQKKEKAHPLEVQFIEEDFK